MFFARLLFLCCYMMNNVIFPMDEQRDIEDGSNNGGMEIQLLPQENRRNIRVHYCRNECTTKINNYCEDYCTDGRLLRCFFPALCGSMCSFYQMICVGELIQQDMSCKEACVTQWCPLGITAHDTCEHSACTAMQAGSSISVAVSAGALIISLLPCMDRYADCCDDRN